MVLPVTMSTVSAIVLQDILVSNALMHALQEVLEKTVQ